MSAREGQTFAGRSLLARYASFVKLPHTLFALPFAGVGAVLASYQHPDRITLAAILWIVVAFTAARFAAMGFNRIVDRAYDARNPRTRERELPAGKLTLKQATWAVGVAAIAFVMAAWALNPLCGYLSPIALGWVFFYSYTKRFTVWSHHVLGLSLAIAPVGAYLAVSGVWPSPWFAPLVLAAAVMFWVAGFDVIYSIADETFDRDTGLRSLAASFGARNALMLARAFHVVSLVLFLALGALRLFPLGSAYLLGVAVMAGLLIYEHLVARGGKFDLTRINRAFFQTNVAVSITVFAFTLLDRML